MTLLLGLVLGISLTTSLVVAAFGSGRESFTYRVASLSMGALVVTVILLIVEWARLGFGGYSFDFGTLYQSIDYEFSLAMYFDRTSAVFVSVITFVAAATIRFCRYYLHREAGYARFFATVYFFLFGMYLLVTAGTLDLLFAGWEVVGISSFLLIAFYSTRIGPVRNALRTFAIYRFCDTGLLMGAWLSNVIWHATQHFGVLTEEGVAAFAGADPLSLLGLSLLILFAAGGKSAQFPFCFWLPRAMEGPTPSSAIFYGALSIHAGVFLLIRTMPIWHAVPAARVAVGVVGALSAIIGTLSSRTQSNIKGQIAYSSIAQVGLMLIEIAFGLKTLVLIHFVANAGLRCYQLLISPSAVAQLLRLQTMGQEGTRVSDWSIERVLPDRLRSTFYVFAVQEGFLENGLRVILWGPLRALARAAQRVGRRLGILPAIIAIVSVTAVAFDWIPTGGVEVFLVILLLGLVFRAAGERDARRAWDTVAFSCLLAGATVFVLEKRTFMDMLVYFSGVLPAWALGRLALERLGVKLQPDVLNAYHGAVERSPWPAFALFLGFLGMAGFPITPAFLGEDLLLHHAVGEHLWVAVAIALAFVLNGLTLAAVYARLCLGPAAE